MKQALVEPGSKRALRGLTNTLATAAALACLATGAAAQNDAPTGYARAGARGTSARNLADRSGHPMTDLAPGTILAVYGQSGDWLQVEAPGGFEVWVYGKYVSETNVAGILQVSGNNVNMRPKPSSDVDSYPLSKRLFAGDRVAYRGRARKSDAWDEDWIQIASPPGVRAWVLRDQVEDVAAAAGEAEWRRASESARAKAVPVPVPSGGNRGGATGSSASAAEAGAKAGAAAAAPLAEEKQAAVRALRDADDLFAAERLKATPDLDAVRAAYLEVLAVTETGATADLARGGVARVDALAEARALQAELEAERLRREEEAQRYQRELEQARDRKQDPFSGRYAYRGWLERIASADGTAPTYVVRFGGRHVVELVCSSGRYSLDDFSGFELGVRGALLREGSEAPEGQAGTILPSLDVGRIEVLSGRSR